MIKVKLYEHIDYRLKCVSLQQEFITYDEYAFIPFLDEESTRLLQMYGIEFYENDCYSIKKNGCRESVFGLTEDIKYALCAIFYSKQGKLISYKKCSEDIINYLASLNIDILIAIDIYEYSVDWPWGYEIEYTIINYPYRGNEIEVNVMNYSKLGTKQYESEICRIKDTSAGLVLGDDGKYYNTTLWITKALRYYWENDIENIISYIEKREYNRNYLIDATKEYDYFSFVKALHATYATAYSKIEYLNTLEDMKDYFGRKGFTKKEIKDIIKKRTGDEEYKKYLWYRDQLKIICHLITCPPKSSFRKPPFLIVTKYSDGRYKIHGELPVKYPEFHEVFSDIVEKWMGDDKEVYALWVEGNELLHEMAEIENVICGFKVTKDCIEIFDKEEAMLMFGSALKEAYYSGKCEIN